MTKLTIDGVAEAIHADGSYCESGGHPDRSCTGACRHAAELVAQMWPDAFEAQS